jgi:ketosteroid isomerase-like protein
MSVMRRIVPALAALALCTFSLAARPAADTTREPNAVEAPSCCGPLQRPETKAAVVEALTRQADAWDKAIVKKDRAAVEANMADDFRNIDGAGTVGEKKAFVEGLMDAKLTIDPYTVEDFDVRLFGDTALLSGRTRMTGTFDGKPFTSHYRYIDIYVKSAGQWKIVSVQITRLAQ